MGSVSPRCQCRETGSMDQERQRSSQMPSLQPLVGRKSIPWMLSPPNPSTPAISRSLRTLSLGIEVIRHPSESLACIPVGTTSGPEHRTPCSPDSATLAHILLSLCQPPALNQDSLNRYPTRKKTRQLLVVPQYARSFILALHRGPSAPSLPPIP